MMLAVSEWKLYNILLFGILYSVTGFIKTVWSLNDVIKGVNVNTTEQAHILIEFCSMLNKDCTDLPAYCYNCDQTVTCNYGDSVNMTCSLHKNIICNSKSYVNIYRRIQRTTKCRYCHQISNNEANCIINDTIRYSMNLPRQYYVTWCYPPDDMFCFGKRGFRRTVLHTYTSGKRYSTGVLLSFFLGGIGADRFYYGMWADGLGKIFSFGGLGVWSIVDFILVAIGYIGPPENENALETAFAFGIPIISNLTEGSSSGASQQVGMQSNGFTKNR